MEAFDEENVMMIRGHQQAYNFQKVIGMIKAFLFRKYQNLSKL